MRDGLTEVIRIGKVSSVNERACTARVSFEDREGIVTEELHVVVPFTLKDKNYYMPGIDERVLCIFLPNAPSRGFVLGSFYAETRTPPTGDKNKFYSEFEDGTFVEYDKKEHKFTLEIPATGETSVYVKTAGDIIVNTAGNLKVDAAKQIDITAAADLNITAGANLTLTAGGTMDITSGGSMTIKGSTVSVN